MSFTSASLIVRIGRTAPLVVLLVGLMAGCGPRRIALGQSAPDLIADPPVAPQADVPAAAADAGNYLIGPDDVLSVVFWREKDMSADVTVRADGKISLPLLNDVHASGLTPLQLREQLEAAAARFVEDPVVTVVVKQINSRKVFITGMVEKPGAYPLTGPMTTLQLIASAGGFKDFANTANVVVVRTSSGQQQFLKFNYQDVARGKGRAKDIALQPGDSVIVR